MLIFKVALSCSTASLGPGTLFSAVPVLILHCRVLVCWFGASLPLLYSTGKSISVASRASVFCLSVCGAHNSVIQMFALDCLIWERSGDDRM